MSESVELSPKPSTSAISTVATVSTVSKKRKSEDPSNVVSTKRYVDHKIRLSEENRAIKLMKNPQIVLEEDDYTKELEKIIVRDYFPEVPRLKFLGTTSLSRCSRQQ